jgi:hypothetical protein
MSRDFTPAPTESHESRLHREYAWSVHDGCVTANGIVFREFFPGAGTFRFKLFREPHHDQEQLRLATEELRGTEPGAAVSIESISTVESWGVAPAPSP